MNELFGNPAVQAGVAPFVAALVVAAVLRHTRWVYWSVGAAFLVVVALTMGFAFEPLTSSRKLVLAVLVALLLLPVLDTALPVAGRTRPLLLALVGAGLGVWLLSRLLVQKELLPALLAGGGAAVFLAGFLAGAQRGSSGPPLQAAALALVLGLGTGALALLGASAQLAQIGIAVGAGAGAAGLALLLARRAPGQGWSLGLLAALVTGLAALLAVFTGQLPWYCLVPLLGTPWAARLVRDQDSRQPWLTALYTAGAAVIPMLLAVALAWSTAGTSTQVGIAFYLT